MAEESKPSEITSRPPLVTFPPDAPGSPAVLYITRDDRLYVRAASNSSAPDFFVAGRILHPDGVIRPFLFTITSGAGGATTTGHELAEGYLLSIAAYGAQTVNMRWGQVFAEVGLMRGRTADLQVVQTFFRGYILKGYSLSWPPGHFESPVDTRGNSGGGTFPNPAAGAEVAITTPNDSRRTLRSIRVQLTTDATVTNRQVRLQLVAAGGVVCWRSEPFAAHPASTARFYNWCVGGEFAAAVANGEYNGYMPEVQLQQTDSWQTSTINLQAGDDFGAPTGYQELVVEDRL